MISEAEARARILEHFEDVPAETILRMAHIGWGGDSDAFLVDDRWIFRFPRYDETLAQLAVEECLLPRLAPRLPLSVPLFTHVARDDGGRPLFAGYEAISGAPGHRPAVAEIAPFLEALREWIVALDARLSEAPFEGVLTHGDLSSDHILCDEGRVTGVIDWSDVSIADPAGDLVWCWDFELEYLDDVLARYASATPEFRERVLMRAALVPLHQIGWGLATGNEADVSDGLDELRESMDELADALGGLAI